MDGSGGGRGAGHGAFEKVAPAKTLFAHLLLPEFCFEYSEQRFRRAKMRLSARIGKAGPAIAWSARWVVARTNGNRANALRHAPTRRSLDRLPPLLRPSEG